MEASSRKSVVIKRHLNNSQICSVFWLMILALANDKSGLISHIYSRKTEGPLSHYDTLPLIMKTIKRKLPCATILSPDLERTSRFEGDGNMAEDVCDQDDNDIVRIAK